MCMSSLLVRVAPLPNEMGFSVGVRNIVSRTQHLLAVVFTHNICCLPGIESIVCHATSARWEVRNCKIPFVSMEDETTLFLGTTMFQMVLMEVGTTLFLGTTVFLLVVIISVEATVPYCRGHSAQAAVPY